MYYIFFWELSIRRVFLCFNASICPIIRSFLHNAVLLTIVPVSVLASPGLICFVTGSLYLWIPLTHFTRARTHISGNHQSILCTHKFVSLMFWGSFRLHISMRQYGIGEITFRHCFCLCAYVCMYICWCIPQKSVYVCVCVYTYSYTYMCEAYAHRYSHMDKDLDPDLIHVEKFWVQAFGHRCVCVSFLQAVTCFFMPLALSSGEHHIFRLMKSILPFCLSTTMWAFSYLLLHDTFIPSFHPFQYLSLYVKHSSCSQNIVGSAQPKISAF